MKKAILFTALFAGLVSCSDNSSTTERKNGYSEVPKTREDSLMQEVMDGHDLTMSKMGKLEGLKKKLALKEDSLMKANPNANKGIIKSLKSMADSLQTSENNMNTWMEAFNIDSAKDEKEKRISYLESEKIKVNKVKNQLLETIALTDSLLNK